MSNALSRKPMVSVFLNAEDRLRSGWKLLAFTLALGAANALTYLLLVKLLGLAKLVRGPAGELIPVGLLVLVSWAALRLEGRSLAHLGLRLDRRWAKELGQGLIAGLALITLTALMLRAVGGFHWEINATFTWRALVGGAWLYLLVAFNEEIAFRGYAFQRLVEGMGPWGTQLLMGALFGLVHLGNPAIRAAGPALKAVTTLNISLAAILLGLAYLRTRSLALPVGIHWAWNWAQGNLLGFAVSGTGLPTAPLVPVIHPLPDWLTGGQVGLEGSPACTLVCLVFILALHRWPGSCPEAAGP